MEYEVNSTVHLAEVLRFGVKPTFRSGHLGVISNKDSLMSRGLGKGYSEWTWDVRQTVPRPNDISEVSGTSLVILAIHALITYNLIPCLHELSTMFAILLPCAGLAGSSS